MTNSGTMYSTLSSHQINSIQDLIDEVSTKQLEDFGNISTELKPDGTLITECDRWSDERIVKRISEIAPQEGVLSEEGSQKVPNTSAYWVVDPLDGTTNFSAGIPYWAISIARFTNGQPETAFLDIPALKKRIFAVRGNGVWINGSKIMSESHKNTSSECVSLCSRSIRILQQKPDQVFPGKIRLLGVSSLNMISVALGQTVAALEATPKIWDLAAAWLVLSELNCSINWLDFDPGKLTAGQNLKATNFPVLVANSNQKQNELLPWGKEILKNHKSFI
tara:strand:- start:57 stop:890 length:834 start_codon:yes stop_codon:yes gene_type:complete